MTQITVRVIYFQCVVGNKLSEIICRNSFHQAFYNVSKYFLNGNELSGNNLWGNDVCRFFIHVGFSLSVIICRGLSNVRIFLWGIDCRRI